MAKEATSLRLAARDRNDATVMEATSYKIDPRTLETEQGFNLRRPRQELRDHIDSLKATIRSGGWVPPILVRMEGTRRILVDGHCRTQAYLELIDEGLEIKYVEAKEYKGNDADRVATMLTSAQSLELTPLERGIGYQRLIRLGWSVQDIVARTGKSATHISTSLKLAEAPQEIQNMINQGEVSSTAALQVIQEQGQEAAAKSLTESAKAAKAAGKKKVTQKDIRAPKVPARYTAKVFQKVETLLGALGQDTREQLAEFEEKTPEELQDKKVTVPAAVFVDLLNTYAEGLTALEKRVKKVRESGQKAKQEPLMLPV